MWTPRLHRKTLVIICVLITSLVSTTLCAEDLPEARITWLEGTVLIFRQNSNVPEVYAFDSKSELPEIFLGDRVLIQDGSFLEMELRDETVVFCESNTELLIQCSSMSVCENDSNESVIHLSLGRIWVYVCKLINRVNHFSVKTPSAVAGVRGTIFAVFVDSDSVTSVSVREGAVEVKAEDVATLVTAGQQIHVDKEKVSAPALQFAEEEAELWKQKQSWIDKIRRNKSENEGIGIGQENPPGLMKKEEHPGTQNQSGGKGPSPNVYNEPEGAKKGIPGYDYRPSTVSPGLAKKEGHPGMQTASNGKGPDRKIYETFVNFYAEVTGRDDGEFPPDPPSPEYGNELDKLGKGDSDMSDSKVGLSNDDEKEGRQRD